MRAASVLNHVLHYADILQLVQLMTDKIDLQKIVSEAKNPVRAAIMELVKASAPGKTICPTEAAQLVSKDNWRKLLKDVRAEAVRLADTGQISIYRKGKPVDPHDFKGVYRLGAASG